MKDVISVIVPVYNVSAYLPECLDSILSQDYEKLEVILIDDGSTDDSGAICDAYAQRDSRIRVIHQKNGGAAAAKNVGLRAATGEYLSFADSDDFLEPGAYAYMMSLLKENGADIVRCAFQNRFRTRTEQWLADESRCVMEGKAFLARFATDWTCGLLWNKLYKRALFDGIFFEEGHKIDDEYFTYQGVMNAAKVVCDPRVVYNYRQRASSVMNNPIAAERRVLDSLEAIGQRRQKIKARYPELQRVFDESYLDALWYLALTPGSTERTIAAQRAALRRYLLEWGNTVPPRRLWRPLLRMYFSSTRKLLKQPQNAIEQTEDYFT
jgi:glycosyltransferase involved in cell wall biosynthesis